MTFANLSGANLREANLSNANLSNANLGDANLSDAVLVDANLSNAILNKANLQHTNLRTAVPFSYSGIRNAIISLPVAFPNLSGANLSGLDLSGLDLREIMLNHADLRKTDLRKADLSGAKLERANLGSEECAYQQAQQSFWGIRRIVMALRHLLPGKAQSRDSNVKCANLSGANLTEAVLLNSSLIGADLSGACLNHANFSHTNISGATLLGASVDSTTSFGAIKCYKTIGDRSTAEYMRDTLGHGQMMDLTIVDDLATLRAEFSGVWGMIHLIGVIVFLLPYVWFLAEQAMASRVKAIADSAELTVEEWAHRKAQDIIQLPAKDFQDAIQQKITLTADQWREKFGVSSPQEITVLNAFARYIWNGGERWREGYFFNGFSFIPFVCVTVYNMLRLRLLIKTKRLETQQSVRQLPVTFSLGNGLISWRTAYVLNLWGYWLTLILVAKNSLYFMSSTIQI